MWEEEGGLGQRDPEAAGYRSGDGAAWAEPGGLEKGS